MNRKIVFFMPVITALAVAAMEFFVPTNPKVNSNGVHYFGYLMLIVAGIFLILAISALAKRENGVKFCHNVKFYCMVMILVGVIEVLTDKLVVLPAVYFPSVNNILLAAISERVMLINCILYTLRLLFLGIIIGGGIGIFTGILLGWSKRINYWFAPISRFIGPLPTAIWIPISIMIFPTVLSASVFIVALTMWFPTNVQTMSGIQNVKKGYYDVADTMGVKTSYQILHIAIPAAMPQIFVGIFSGVTASFISLMMAELMGSKYGIGWYINWKQQIMAYPNVWCALIMLAIMCFLVLKLLFALRKRFLGWKEGMIRW